ncbi:MAG: hypothetical protein HKN67_01730, partial [Saprospiraceae bacterium]|nr:hypothetical protein [Saprospiraceae bacterium]
VGGGGAIACNNHVNVSLDNNCEAAFEWYTLLEGDYIPNVFEAEFTDDAGNIIQEEDIPLYVGTIINYSIIDMCNGNSCWGTMSIEDKSVPELDCDCPVGGEDFDNDGIVDGYSEECTRSCYELPLIKDKYWDRLRDEIISEDLGDFIDDHVTSICDDVTEDAISFYDVFEDLECGGSLLRRTWTVSYDKGNGHAGSVSCTEEYLFKSLDINEAELAIIDPSSGIINPVENRLVLPIDLVEMDCGSDISPESIAAFFDNPATVDKDTDNDRIDPDELDIDLVIENNEGIPYAYPHYYIKGRNPSGPHPQAIDNEICNILVAYTDTQIEACAPGCGGNQKVLRKWTILDWCAGEFISHEQIIKAVDKNGPTIGVSNVLVSVDPWRCSADVELPLPDHLYDDCLGEVNYWIGKVDGALTVSGNAEEGFVMHDVPQGITRVEYVAEDCCGNLTNTFIEVNVSDLTPPVPVTKEFIVVSLTNIGNPVDGPQGIAKVYARDVDNGSYDGCTGIDVSVRKTQVVCSPEDTVWGEYVKFCCEDLDGLKFVEIDVEFRVTDENGNNNYAWSTVRLEDKSSPTQECPADLILTCDMDYNDFTITGLPQSFGACGEILLECDINDLIEDTEPRRKGPNDGFFNDPRYDGVEVPAYDPSCGYGAVRRQFKSCSSCTQWFVIEPIDPFNPATIQFPEDVVVDCDAFETGEPTWENSVCTLIGVSLESDTFLFEDGACFKILNHWSVINWCVYDPVNPSAGGKYEHTQVVKIIDTQDPVVTAADSLYFDVDADCVSSAGQLTARANDEGQCGSKWIKWELTLDLNADWTADYLMSSAFPQLVNGDANPY